MNIVWKIALASAFAAGTPAFADDGHADAPGAHGAGPVQKAEPAAKPRATAQSQSMSEGEIRRVDKATKKLTVRHGPLQNLDMPGMTMVFQVQDPSFLDQVKPGDKVRFVAEKLPAGFTITALEPAK